MKKLIILLIAIWIGGLGVIHAEEGSVEVVVYTQDHQIITDAVFTLYKDQVEYMRDIQSDEEGKIELKQLPEGSYRLKQTATQKGYEIKSESVVFYYQQGQKLILEPIINTQMLGSLQVMVVDEQDHPISQQRVIVTSSQQEMKELLTDEQGICYMEQMALGEYYLEVENRKTSIMITTKNYDKQYQLKLYAQKPLQLQNDKKAKDASIMLITAVLLTVFAAAFWYLRKQHFMQWLDETDPPIE